MAMQHTVSQITDLLQIRREIFQLEDSKPPVDRRRHAVEWIAAWKLKGDISPAVESTAHLVDAMLHDDSTQNSVFSVRATYSAAFCRFVTLFTDVGKSSMVAAAKDLNMPTAFVELRHEATHEELPSLPRLRRHTKLSLDWLWQHYWAGLEDMTRENDTSIDPKLNSMSPDFYEHLLIICSDFIKKRRTELVSGSMDMSKDGISGTTCLQLIQLCLGRPDALRKLVSVMVRERKILPKGKEFSEQTMEGAFMIWDNLLRRLAVHQKQFFKILMQEMIASIGAVKDVEVVSESDQNAISSWMIHIFRAEEWHVPVLHDLVEKNRKFVIYECMLNGDTRSKEVSNELLRDAPPKLSQALRAIYEEVET